MRASQRAATECRGLIGTWVAASLLAACADLPQVGSGAAELDAPSVVSERAPGPAIATDAGGRSDAVSAARDGGLAPRKRPAGVATCYTPESSNHPATQYFWRVYNTGAYAARAGAIGDLEAATVSYPESEEFFWLLGLANIWRIYEPNTAGDLALAVVAADAAKTALERALTLCPSDHRVGAFLGATDIMIGNLFGDAALVDKGTTILNEAIAFYPMFATFGAVYAYANLPADDPKFVNMVAAVRAIFDGVHSPCFEMLDDPVCINTPHVPHNAEGTGLVLGDLFAKAQDRATALAVYRSSRAGPGWSSWAFKDVLEERIRSLDQRMAGAATPLRLDDPEWAWNSGIACSMCHRGP